METSKRKILLICPFSYPNVGGVESHIDKLIDFADKRNFHPVLITYQPLTSGESGLSHESNDKYEVYRVSWFGKGWFPVLEKYHFLTFLYLFPGLFFKSILYMTNHSDEIKVIHAHGLASAAIGLILKVLFNKKVIVSTHAVYSFSEKPLLSWIILLILSRLDLVLAVSEISRNELIAIGISPELVRVHKNWIPTDIFTVGKSDEKALPEKKQKSLLFVGRLLEKKGVLLFLKMAEKFKEINFHVVGTGPLEKTVADFSKIHPNLKYHGVLDQHNKEQLLKLLDLYRSCDFLVSPYLYEEGFSTTLLESLACGTPVVITNRGSPPTFLNKEVAVYLDSADVEKSLEDFVSDYDKDPEGMRVGFQMQVCRKFAEDSFGIKNAEEIIKGYEL